MKVSIIMLAYNHERFIAQALESVLMQKVDFDYELIVGEDCSPDATRKVIDSYREKFGNRMKPIYREKNVGAHQNLQDCIERSQGEYLAFLEGDDYWTDPEKLAKQVDFLDHNKDFAVCVHNWNIVDINGKIDRTGHQNTEDVIYTVEDLNSFQLPAQTATIMMRNLSVDMEEKYGKVMRLYGWIPMDTLYIPAIMTYGKIYIMREVMSSYRFYIEEGGSNWSSTHENHGKNRRLYFFMMMLGFESYCKRIRIDIDMLEKRAELFLENYRHRRYSSRKKEKIDIYLQALGMLCAEPHKIRLIKEVQRLRKKNK